MLSMYNTLILSYNLNTKSEVYNIRQKLTETESEKYYLHIL